MELHETLIAQMNLVALARAVGQAEGQTVGDDKTVEQLAALAELSTH